MGRILSFFNVSFTVSNEKRLKMAKVEPAPSAVYPAGGALNDSVWNKASVRTWLEKHLENTFSEKFKSNTEKPHVLPG